MKRKVISLPPPPVKIGGGRHPIEADAPAARILMVDDHPPNLMALDAILDPLGQELLHAHSGEEALRQLLETDFALILMDVQMPGLDGIQTAKMIKERPRNRHIPIIFLTAITRTRRTSSAATRRARSTTSSSRSIPRSSVRKCRSSWISGARPSCSAGRRRCSGRPR